MNKFEKIQIGDSAELSHDLTQSDIAKFVELTGDDNKLHVDADYAGKTSMKKPVAHGMLGASFISTIIGTKLPGDGALWFAQSLEFLLPVRVGDQITVRAEVIKKHEASKSIELKTEIFNQHRQKVTTGTAKVKIVEQESSEPVKTPVDSRKKVALVIGAAGGIGSSISQQLAQDGLQIAMNYFSNESGAATVRDSIVKAGGTAALFRADIRDEKQVQEMVERIERQLGQVDILINCATGKVPAIKFSNLNWNDLQSHFEVNIHGTFNLLKFILPGMEKCGYGKIINLVTQYIESTPPTELLHYVTAKAALSGFSRALAAELAPKGIRVNMVSPGMTETELISDIPEKTRLLMAAKAPLRRLALPQDVANVVSFLASDKSDYLTGETIRVSGGQVML